MELDYLVLADAISARPDGKLDLHGVGWDTIVAGAVPVTHPRMDVAVRFLLAPHELESQHTVVLMLVGQDGDELARIKAEITPMPEAQRKAIPPGRRVGVGIVMSLAGVTFHAYGPHLLVVTWDGTEVREPLRLFVAPPPAPQG